MILNSSFFDPAVLMSPPSCISPHLLHLFISHSSKASLGEYRSLYSFSFFFYRWVFSFSYTFSSAALSQLRAQDPVLLQVPDRWAGRNWRPLAPHCCYNSRAQGADRPEPVLLLHPDRRLWSKQLSYGGALPGWCCLWTFWVQQREQHWSRALETH